MQPCGRYAYRTETASLRSVSGDSFDIKEESEDLFPVQGMLGD